MPRAIVTLLLLTLIFPGVCYPCRCVPPDPKPSLSDIRDDFIILEGVVEELKYFHVPPENAPQITFDSNLLVTFQVTQSWSGPVGESVTFWTHSEESACGYTFAAGHRYIVFVRKTNNTVDLCGLTEPAGSARKLRSELDGLAPEEVGSKQ